MSQQRLILRNKTGSKYEQHPFHLVDPSPLPFLLSAGLGITLCFIAFLMHGTAYDQALFIGKLSYSAGAKAGELAPHFTFVWESSLIAILIMFIWAWDVSTESTIQGYHTRKVQQGIRAGMVLFIASEVLFFFSFFWAFFHSAAAPAVGIGCVWPPVGIEVLIPWHLPLANTVILLSSGVCTIWAHRALISGNKQDAMSALFGACMYGLLFSWFQFLEYGLADFAINDSVYGSVFYMATGFHGLHVIVGTILLLISYWRLVNDHFSRERHLGFETAAWYWHFVDVVWLFLYIVVYWW